MLYTRKTFTVPASSGATTSQRRWDYATMPKQQFIETYHEYTVEPINQAPAIPVVK